MFFYRLKACWNGCQIQIASNLNIQGISYVCNDWIFYGLLFTSDKIYLETTFYRFIALFIALLLASFEYKSFNYLNHSEFLKMREKSSSATFSFEDGETQTFLESLKTHCDSSIWAIWTQKVSKEAQWTGLWILKDWFPKNICLTGTGGRQKLVHYIHMIWLWCFNFKRSVQHCKIW